MVTTLQIKGYFTKQMVRLFKNDLKKVKPKSTVYIRIESQGGNLYCANVMARLVYYMWTKHECRFIAEIVHAESAALLFAVNMHERHIVRSSTGSIHLPVPIEGKQYSERIIEVKRQKIIDYLVKRIILSREEIVKYESLLLDSKELLAYKIATKLVDEFQPLTV